MEIICLRSILKPGVIDIPQLYPPSWMWTTITGINCMDKAKLTAPNSICASSILNFELRSQGCTIDCIVSSGLWLAAICVQ
ncbi:hypothetical protein TNCT_542711 [Trichonephila clavata]|uniref:Uncharacterized protein n=1 Tax=Trichonephila clavata TaxID=2740835 RepID=A0A8X6FY41_TRICU|nr:hypothetical protein TNCT_542711 [Trichonephila clavata]